MRYNGSINEKVPNRRLLESQKGLTLPNCNFRNRQEMPSEIHAMSQRKGLSSSPSEETEITYTNRKNCEKYL